jgi:hypothetical protein
MFGTDGSFALPPHCLGLQRSGGAPLPGALLGRMQAAFGADFSAVRIHEGPQAARLGALAFTVGSDIYFAPGRYRPGTPQGRLLLGHELAHVLQQCQGRVKAPAGARICVVVDEYLEDEADAMGLRALSAAPVRSLPPGFAATPVKGGGRVLQAFWVLRDGRRVWLPADQWNPDIYEYATWTWPCCGLPRRVYRKKPKEKPMPKKTTSPFGNEYSDESYDKIRDQLLDKIGIDFSKPESWPKEDTDRIAQLFKQFTQSKPDWFVYTMIGLPFEYLLKSESEIEKDGLGGGDCLTLCSVFIAIAGNEFGIKVKLECYDSPFMTDGKATIDGKAAGNCDNGKKWFFQNHYWVSFKDKAYDILFGSEGAPQIDEKWVLDQDRDPAAVLKNNTVVIPGKQYKNQGIRGRLSDAYKTASLEQ